MADAENVRAREKEPPPLSNYEMAIRRHREIAERNRTGRVVCKLDEVPQEITRQGRLRTYLGLNVKDTPLQDWIVFTHEIRTASGKHKHQGGLIIYVIEGKGYSVVDGERIDWAPDTLFVTPPGAVHSHHNRGDKMMLSYVVQDTGVHSQLRTTNFAWTE